VYVDINTSLTTILVITLIFLLTVNTMLRKEYLIKHSTVSLVFTLHCQPNKSYLLLKRDSWTYSHAYCFHVQRHFK